MAAPTMAGEYETLHVLDPYDAYCALDAIDDFYAYSYQAPLEPMLAPVLEPMLVPALDPMLEPMLASGSQCEMESPPDLTLASIPGLPPCIELDGGTLCIDAPETAAVGEVACQLGLSPADLGVTTTAPGWLSAVSTCAIPAIPFDPPLMMFVTAPRDPHATVKEYWAAVGRKPTCFRTNYFEAESRAFPTYREQAAAAFNQILIDYLDGKLTLDEYKKKLGEWHTSYTQKYANCGERAKLVASIAASQGYESYACVRKTGDHEFPIIVMDGKLFIVEAWPDKPGGFEMTEVTARKDGRALTLPIADWNGVELVGTDGTVKETSGGCNVVLRR